jgi:hypothetical protein
MFEVRVKFPFDGDFKLNDDRLEQIAGKSEFSGAGMGFRDHGYTVETFAEALDMKETIKNEFPLWEVVFYEQTTYDHPEEPDEPL